MPEEPTHAVITSRFDLGFILEHPKGNLGQLRVPEMSQSTLEWNLSEDKQAGIGNTVDVYVVHKIDGDFLFSEFSAEERSARDKEHEDRIKAQEQAEIGQSVNVRIERKFDWGCICRQKERPFIEGVIATPETITKNQLPSQCATGPADWDSLTEGATVRVVVSHKQWAHWRYMLYFSLQDSPGG